MNNDNNVNPPTPPPNVNVKIDLQNLFIHLIEDSQFDGGIYTTDNISPDHIEVVDLKKR